VRATGLVLLFLFAANLLLPGLVVVDFLMDRERIMQELCVQRIVPDEMRTCHGDCYLSRQLKNLDQREQGFPVALRAMKPFDAVPAMASGCFAIVAVNRILSWVSPAFSPLTGHLPPCDPVPWC